MSIQTDSLDAIFSDLAVTCVAGGVTGKAILNQPTSIIAGDQVLTTSYVLHCKNSDFGSLVAGTAISVGGVNYKIISNEKDLDGLTCQMSLEKV